MEATTMIKPKGGDAVVLIGTTKGAFLLRSDKSRKKWDVSGPHFPGHVVYAMAYDGRAGQRRLWFSSFHWAYGTTLRNSDDFGKSWSNPEGHPIKFPEDTGQALKQIWQIMPAGDDPNHLYCGVEPASLFESRDGGNSWSLVRGLFNHPHREKWNPGNGGLCMHTVLPDPKHPNRVLVAVSAAGVYRTDDGGKTWQARNKGLKAEFMPEGSQFPEFGQCVHKVARHPSRPEQMFLQNHGGLYRSDDAGDSWTYIGEGVPSDFGFPMVQHPHDPDTAYIFPLEREMRVGPEGKVRVYRTRNKGKAWEPLTKGLAQKNAFETVLRDAMASDTFDPAGIYFGTRTGKLFGSANEGGAWQVIVEGLPPITCVRAAMVDGDGMSGRAKPGKAATKGKAKKAGKGR